MVAGPPKVRIVAYCFVLVFLLVLPRAALGQDTQSSLLTVEDLITVITDVDTLTDAQKETLSASLLDIADSGSFSPDDLLSVLSMAEMGSVFLAEADFVVAALETAFAVLLSGEADLSMVMNALFRALDTQDLGLSTACCSHKSILLGPPMHSTKHGWIVDMRSKTATHRRRKRTGTEAAKEKTRKTNSTLAPPYATPPGSSKWTLERSGSTCLFRKSLPYCKVPR